MEEYSGALAAGAIREMESIDTDRGTVGDSIVERKAEFNGDWGRGMMRCLSGGWVEGSDRVASTISQDNMDSGVQCDLYIANQRKVVRGVAEDCPGINLDGGGLVAVLEWFNVRRASVRVGHGLRVARPSRTSVISVLRILEQREWGSIFFLLLPTSKKTRCLERSFSTFAANQSSFDDKLGLRVGFVRIPLPSIRMTTDGDKKLKGAHIERLTAPKQFKLGHGVRGLEFWGADVRGGW
ncbi:hypothetical protein FB45DRAFT_999087 [Roridomyces roridus]|uniref:Uncharacterized protein n=1 Tax=Roridomyces roridus TaxID=1738132 RepID=A0AAD7CA72_9AGAR|nr:hypothetical protein FB45DRAFT_999087 [Roridomyces roridus]